MRVYVVNKYSQDSNERFTVHEGTIGVYILKSYAEEDIKIYEIYDKECGETFHYEIKQFEI